MASYDVHQSALCFSHLTLHSEDQCMCRMQLCFAPLSSRVHEQAAVDLPILLLINLGSFLLLSFHMF